MSGGFERAVRVAVHAALTADVTLAASLNRVSDGAAERAAPPWAEVGETLGSDWGAKDRPGRDVRLTITVFDRGQGSDGAARIGDLLGAVETVLGALPRTIGGFETSGAVIVRTRMTQRSDGLRSAALDVRIRGLQI
jgi:hypothetical protein